MEPDKRIELDQKIRGVSWEDRLNETHKSGKLCGWVSTFHHNNLPCQLSDYNPFYGSYNAGFELGFGNGTTWLLRFPRVGKVHDDYADEKVAMEVVAINLIRRETTIPLPKIEAWGMAAKDPLGLGPSLLWNLSRMP